MRRVLVTLILAAAAAAVGCQRAAPPAFAYTNRLAAEPSPYLQQHAHNPVDWYPWGDEAFAKARREDKPIFLSIGYSTCHWCHVMEAESFTNKAIADYMNAHFVSIKVDREERPDLDRVYQNYVIGVSEGGWPASLFLTPDLRPFFGANYLPPDDEGTTPGFRTILQRVSTMWETNRAAALQAAAEGTQALEARSQATTGAAAAINVPQLLDDTFHGIAGGFDAAAGGFGGAPKFPRPVVLTFLTRYYARTGTRPALDMTLATLRGMAAGGIHDQLGGGFHRYATDRDWLVPHFEKMLYDQAQLITAYTEAYQISHDPLFREVAADTIEYVLRDLRDPEGGFYSAEDADSKATATATTLSEGAFYNWTRSEVDRIAGGDAAVARAYFAVGPDDQTGALHVRQSVKEAAAHAGKSETDVRAAIGRVRNALREARATRPRPARDDKVLVAWNGLMLSALARSAQVLDDPRYLAAAVADARFIAARLYDPKARVMKRRYRQGKADIDALLEDYAFLVQGLLDLYETSFDSRWLESAMRLQEDQDRLFWDASAGGYFSTRADAADVLTRAKEEYDGAEPAANSVSAMNLLRLWRITTQSRWRQRADATIAALSPRLTRSGGSLPQLLAAVDYSTSRSREIVIVGDPNGADTRALLRLVHDRFIPNKTLVVTDEGQAQERLKPLVPFVDGMTRRDGRATIYVCENYACRLPTSDLTVAARLLSE
jgi:uncharacterized protein YyaL (SSP411 family)